MAKNSNMFQGDSPEDGGNIGEAILEDDEEDQGEGSPATNDRIPETSDCFLPFLFFSCSVRCALVHTNKIGYMVC